MAKLYPPPSMLGPTVSALRCELVVYEQGTKVCVGKATLNVLPDGTMSTPTMVDFKGNALGDQAYSLEWTERKTLVVIPQRHKFQ